MGHINKHIFFILYAPVYAIWFFSLEKWTNRDFTILYCTLDDMIPFVPAFIIPYYIWFAFVAFFCVYFYMKMPQSDAVKLFANLEISMTITLIIYTVWPNAISLRITDLQPDGIFNKLVYNLWNFDTDTNVCPSLHVMNTLTIMVAYFKSGKFKGKHLQNTLLVILAAAICASTVFLKQHSIIDVFAAFGLCAVCSSLIYLPDWNRIFSSKKAGKTVNELQP